MIPTFRPDTARLAHQLQPSVPSKPLDLPPAGRSDVAQDTLLDASKWDATFDKFTAEVFATPERPIAYIARTSRLDKASEGERSSLGINNFWANLDDKKAYQMCSAGEVFARKKRTDGTYVPSQIKNFLGNVKILREDNEVTLSDERGYTVKLFQLPQDAAITLLQSLYYVPLPRARQLIYLHQLPDERFFAVTRSSYSWDYEAFLGKAGAMVRQQVLVTSTFRDGGTTYMTVDTGIFHFPSLLHKDRVATFCFAGAHDKLPLKTFSHEENLAIAKSLGVIKENWAPPVLPDLSRKLPDGSSD